MLPESDDMMDSLSLSFDTDWDDGVPQDIKDFLFSVREMLRRIGHTVLSSDRHRWLSVGGSASSREVYELCSDISSRLQVVCTVIGTGNNVPTVRSAMVGLLSEPLLYLSQAKSEAQAKNAENAREHLQLGMQSLTRVGRMINLILDLREEIRSDA